MKTKLDSNLARRFLTASVVSLAAAFVASPAMADEEEASVSTSSLTGGSVASAGDTDHSKVVGRLAVMWLGVQGVPIGEGTYAETGTVINNAVVRDNDGGCGLPNSTDRNVLNITCRPKLTNSVDTAQVIQAPTLGVRYWLSEQLGIDVGLGIGYYSGSTKSYPYSYNAASLNIEEKKDKVSIFAMTIHAGVPIVLGQPSKHYTFQVIPEANIGFASGTQKDHVQPSEIQPNSGATPPAPTREDISLGGFRLDVGARAGAEIQFGFLGIPELALQGTIGLHMSYRSVSATTGGKTASDSITSLSTSVQQAPWAIFTNNISALYYF